MTASPTEAKAPSVVKKAVVGLLKNLSGFLHPFQLPINFQGPFLGKVIEHVVVTQHQGSWMKLIIQVWVLAQFQD